MNLNLCRLCYEENACINIFQSEEMPTPYVKIKACCGTVVNIDENDGLPSSICKGCLLELDDSYRFLQICKAADKKIRSLASEAPRDFKSDSANEMACFDEDQTQQVDVKANTQDMEQYLDLEVNDRIKPMFTWNKEIKKLICTACGKKCKTWTILAFHLRVHTNEDLCHCPFCDKSYTNISTLSKHINGIHLNKYYRKYICDQCGKGFKSNLELKSHIAVHSSYKPFVCNICSVRFKRAGTMARHKKKHMSNKSYMCATCGKCFWTVSGLNIHSIVHEDVKKFECTYCHSRYKHKGNLQAHLRVHLEPNQVTCHYCGREFTHKFDLVKHIRSKHS